LSDKTEHPAVPEAFAALGVRPSILRGLAEAKFTTPSDIQSMMIPRALDGVDILGQARTGTGKTAAFAIPLLQRCDRQGAFQAMVLVPTRELAVQVDEEIRRLGQFTPIRSVAVYGGQKIAAQVKHLRHEPQILVGTPGRVMDLLERRLIWLRNTRFAVLDEVDRMLDIGFRDDIRRILTQLRQAVGDAGPGGQADDPARQMPDKPYQLMFVSATISSEIERLARTYMHEPVEKLVVPGADEKPTVSEVEQWYFSVQPWDKPRLLRALLQREQPQLAIVFCRTKHGAHKLARRLQTEGIECCEIHGDLIQSKRDRVMKGFRGGKFDVLVATDLASRGIDVADISHIINYDVPEDPEVYVHRVGRTARMGAAGKAFTFITREQGDELTNIESLINQMIPQATLEGFEARPTPGDWDERVGHAAGPAPAAPPPRPAAPVVTLPARPLTIGSKIPLSKRRRRR